MRHSKHLSLRLYTLSPYSSIGSLKFLIEPNAYQNIYHDKNTNTFAQIDGYVFNSAYINWRTTITKARLISPFETPGTILKNYNLRGIRYIQTLNGIFNIIFYNAVTETFTIITDRFGGKPLYYHNAKSLFIFASELKAFPKDLFSSKTINWKSVASILSYQQIFGDETLIKNISSVPSASILVRHKNGSLSIRKYRAVVPIKRKSTVARTGTQSVAHAVKLYRNAILKTAIAAHGSLTLPLSGGYDTRNIISTIKQYTDIPFQTITTDKDLGAPLDSVIAKQVAQKLNIKNFVKLPPSDLYKRYLRKKIEILDGMITEEHLWIMPLLSTVKEPTTLLDGFGGDILGIQHENSYFLDKEQWEITPQDLHDYFFPQKRPSRSVPGVFYPRITFNLNYLRGVLKHIYFARVQKYRDTQLNTLFKDILKNAPHTIYFAFKLEKGRRNTLHLPQDILGAHGFVMMPYLENQLFDYVSRIPADMKKEMNFAATITNLLSPQSIAFGSTNDPEIVARHKCFPRKAIFKNQGTTAFLLDLLYLMRTSRILKETSDKPAHTELRKIILNRSSHQEIALVEFLYWYATFVETPPRQRGRIQIKQSGHSHILTKGD